MQRATNPSISLMMLVVLRQRHHIQFAHSSSVCLFDSLHIVMCFPAYLTGYHGCFMYLYCAVLLVFSAYVLFLCHYRYSQFIFYTLYVVFVWHVGWGLMGSDTLRQGLWLYQTFVFVNPHFPPVRSL